VKPQSIVVIEIGTGGCHYTTASAAGVYRHGDVARAAMRKQGIEQCDVYYSRWDFTAKGEPVRAAHWKEFVRAEF
jgi:hypothetical protein